MLQFFQVCYSRYEDKQKGTVGKMDNFIDKLAQKFNAQEIIKANSQAEAEEMKKLQQQVAEYERILQDIRKLNYKNTELSRQLGEEIGDNADKIAAMREDEQRLISALRDITQEQSRNREADLEKREQERLEKDSSEESELAAMRELLEEKFQSADDFVHKENVKVYRNVQAVVVDELKKYAEGSGELKSAVESMENTLNKKIRRKLNVMLAVSVLSMLAALAGAALCALMAAGLIK
ncbi:MAG: hypothetical protein LUE96_10210 [Lachnospiraceae bacterium]|nr:hypothetical protein [Lachnospiraceae bacterium]